MKTALALLLVLLGFAAHAQNYAVQISSGDTNGIPDGWPRLIRPLGAATGPLFGAEQLKTTAELETIRATLKPAMDARDAAEAAARATRERTREDLVRDAKQDIRAALRDWDTLTAAQQRALTKRLAQVMLRILLNEDE